jgi:hypothetical protein
MYLPFGNRQQASGYRHQGEFSYPAHGSGRVPGAAPDPDPKTQSRTGYEPLKPEA